MPLAKIHVLEGQYDEARLGRVSSAVQNALISVLGIPPDDFFQIIHELPGNRFLHTPSFLGMKYLDDFILLELTFISGRPRETRLALLEELNARVVAGAGISPDDLMIQLSEGPGENFSFGQGLAQRAFVSQTVWRDKTRVRHFYVDNLRGHLDATLAAANSTTGAAYPPGSVIQLVPGEAMVKRDKGFNTTTHDWEFFELDVSKDGTQIRAQTTEPAGEATQVRHEGEDHG